MLELTRVNLIICLKKFFDNIKLEDLKVLKHSPDLLNNVKIGLGQLWLIMKHTVFNQIWGLWPFKSSDLKQSPNKWSWIKGHRSA